MAKNKEDKLKLGFYCEDSEYKLYGPFKTSEECEKYDYKNIWHLVKVRDYSPKINKITVNFTSNTLTIEGDKDCELKLLDKTISNGTHTFLPESWELILSKTNEACKNVVIIGKPFIEGECLDEVLYMRS